MTLYSDDFSTTLDKTKWLIRPDGTNVTRQAAYDSVHGNVDSEFMTYNPTVTSETMTYTATGATFTMPSSVSSLLGTDEGIIGYVSSNVSTPLTAGETYVFKRTSASVLEAYDTSGSKVTGGSNSTCVVTFQTLLSSTDQRQRAVVYSLAQSATNYIILWNRFDPRRTPATQSEGFKYGYGCGLFWNADGTRSLKLLKINYSTSALVILASSDDITLIGDDDDEDIGVGQLITFDTIDVSGDGAKGTVQLNAYLNTIEDTDATLSYTDVGSTQGTAPVNVPFPPNDERPGTFAVTFGEGDSSGLLSVHVDSWEGEDGFRYYEKAKPLGRTLLELRTNIKSQVASGGNTNYDDDFIDDMINDSIAEVLDELGQKNEFSRALKTITLTCDSDYLVTLPHYMDSVVAIYDGTSKNAVQWRLISRNENDQVVIHMEDNPAGSSYQIAYLKRWTPLSDDGDVCPIPRRWDDVVRMGVLLRVGGEDDRDGRYEKSLDKRYARRLVQFKRYATRMFAQRKPVMRVHLKNPLSYDSANWGTY